MPKLTAKKDEDLRGPGSYGDGLYLRVDPSGAKSWILRTVVHGLRRDLLLGSTSLTSLTQAGTRARE